MDVEEVPARVTKKYLNSLSPKEKETVLEIKKEQLRLARLESKKLYQKLNKEKVNEYQRERRRKLKEEKILEEARRILEERGEE